MSEVFRAALDAANAAFDEHCDAWDALQKIPEPTSQDIDDWLAVRERANKAQDAFEQIARQVHEIK